MPQPSKQTLTCSQCGFENEPERVYCHNCGTKLDRSLLPKEAVNPEEVLRATRRRVRKLASPGSGWLEFKTACSTLAWAALVASLYLLLSPPALPPLPREKEVGANLISVVIEDALQSPAASVLRFTEADLSQHMRSRVKGAEVIPSLEFKRAYARLADGKITVGVEQDLFGLPLFTSAEYQLEVAGGKLIGTLAGMHLGRLGIDPRIPKVDAIFAPLWKALKREAPLLDRVQAVSVGADAVTLALKPAPPQR